MFKPPFGEIIEVKVWERPFFRLLAVFFILGLFAWWTFRTVSLPLVLRDLFEEDGAIATAATPETEEEKFLRELSQLPAPPEVHAPEVAALIERLNQLPAVPYLVQAARQRDAARREGEPAVPWSEEEKRAEDTLRENYLKAWEPFFSAPPPDWVRFPDSTRLFRANLADLLDRPPGYNLGDFLAYDLSRGFLKSLRHLGALRFGFGLSTMNPWGNTDVIGLFRTFCEMTQDGLLPSESFFSSRPPPPDVGDLRQALRVDQALFLRAAEYLENLPENISGVAALSRYLKSPGDADWFLQKAGPRISAPELAAYLRRDAAQIATLEQKTFLSGPAWRQWLEGDPGAGLSPTLQAGLGGLREFEQVRLRYQVTLAMLEARQKVLSSGLEAATRVPDPAQPGDFLMINQGEEFLSISSKFRIPDASTNGMTIAFPSETASEIRP